MRLVAYVRVSTAKQADEAQQVTALRFYFSART
jgi:DNA invertase Pin-like site-specific DNA recombinase